VDVEVWLSSDDTIACAFSSSESYSKGAENNGRVRCGALLEGMKAQEREKDGLQARC